MNFDLSGKIAVVTGGNGGIGFGMARGLADAGATVIITGRNAEKNELAATELGPCASAVRLDVTNEEDCRGLFADIDKRFGKLDILINNAGINVRVRPEDLKIEDWRKVIDTNVTSAFICSQLAYPLMLKAGGGKIINIGSMTTMFASPITPAYAASKGAIVQLGRSLTTAWAKDNIQINAVLPGWINTDLTRAARRDIPGLNENVLSRTPANRWGEPEDLAGIAVFLSSDASNFVNGAAIPVDGGFAVRG